MKLVHNITQAYFSKNYLVSNIRLLNKIKLLLTAVSIIFSTSVYGQNPYQITDTTKVWSTISIGYGSWNVCMCGGTKTNKFVEDTIIGGNTYLEVLESEDSLQGTWNINGFLREDTINKLVYFGWNYDYMGLIYDFNIEVDDTVYIDNYYTGYTSILICESIDSVLINDIFRNRYFFSSDYTGPDFTIEVWIEGIGSLYGILNSGFGGPAPGGGAPKLLCCSKNDNQIYMDSLFGECYIDQFYPQIIQESYDTAYVDIYYEFQLQLNTFDVDSFALIGEVIPEGFSFNQSTGLLTGTPTETGAFPCIITVANYDMGSCLTDMIYADIQVVLPTGDCENFDALTVGGYVAEQLGAPWTTWNGAPSTSEDAIVSDLYSVSPNNSILVEGTTDLVRMFADENLTSGTYFYTHDIYIPNGTTGYWNLQKDVVMGAEWGFQVMYEDDMTMIVDAGEAAAAIVPYMYDTWYHSEVLIDLDNDWCEFFIDDNLIIAYQWTLGTFGTPGANTLGSVNFYANPGGTGIPAGAHFDNVCFSGGCSDPFNPPNNFVVTEEGYATWDAPDPCCHDFLGFNVYLDGELISSKSYSFQYIFLTPGETYIAGITAVYDGGESMMVEFEFTYLDNETCEDFDDLNVGGGVRDQLGGMWYAILLPGNPEDAIISDLYSVSPSNSFLVEETTNLFRLFANENLTSGSYTFTHNIYIPTGTTGYWNLQKDVVFGIEWGFQIMYEDDMTMVIDAGGAAAAVIPYNYNTWYHNVIVVDLDNDWCSFYIDGELIIDYQWTLGIFGEPGANTLGSVNFYANPGAGGTPPGAHFDDVCFSNSSVGPFDPPTNFSFYPETNMLCWSPPYGGDGQRLVFETQNSRDLICYNLYINGSLVGTTTDLCWQLDNLTPGVYIFGVSAVYDGGESEIVEIEIIVPNNEPCENFDELTVGGLVAEQLGGMWVTLGWIPGVEYDAIVSDLYSVSPSNSFLIVEGTDLLRLFANQTLTSGSYVFTHNIYIPTGTTGYWNLQKDVYPGVEWGFQIMYDDNMTAVIDAGGQAAAIVAYSYDTWYHNKIIIDLDNDWCEFYIDDELIIGYQWTLGTFGNPGANTLGSVNFYANPGAAGTPPGSHFDDVCFSSCSPNPLYPPTNLFVDNQGYATWGDPGGGSQKLVFVTRDLTYNVYLDDDLVGNTSNLFWQYTNLIDEQTYTTGVSALYNQGESNIVEYQFLFGTIGVPEILENAISIFPNPANNNVNIQSDFNITDIAVYDYVGKLINTIKDCNTKNLVLNTSSYGTGMYLVKIETEKGSTTKRIVISR